MPVSKVLFEAVPDSRSAAGFSSLSPAWSHQISCRKENMEDGANMGDFQSCVRRGRPSGCSLAVASPAGFIFTLRTTWHRGRELHVVRCGR
ncbi:hypothetical protein GN956_G14758 [Arapaima gigas]